MMSRFASSGTSSDVPAFLVSADEVRKKGVKLKLWDVNKSQK